MVSPGLRWDEFPFCGVQKSPSGGSWSPPVCKRCELGLGLTLARENLAVAMLGELQLMFVLTKCPTCSGVMAPFVNLKNAFKKKNHLKRRE